MLVNRIMCMRWQTIYIIGIFICTCTHECVVLLFETGYPLYVLCRLISINVFMLRLIGCPEQTIETEAHVAGGAFALIGQNVAFSIMWSLNAVEMCVFIYSARS